jgi:lysyl-tRNA synthetase class I
MPRKNFLSSDFFVPTTENEAKSILRSLPGHVSQLTLLKEDTIIHSTRFLYHNSERNSQCYVDVTLLQLNDQYIRFSLHGSYTNGQAIQSDTEILNILQQFEKSVQAAVCNDFTHFQTVNQPAPKKSFSFLESIMSLLVSKYHY